MASAYPDDIKVVAVMARLFAEERQMRAYARMNRFRHRRSRRGRTIEDAGWPGIIIGIIPFRAPPPPDPRAWGRTGPG